MKENTESLAGYIYLYIVAFSSGEDWFFFFGDQFWLHSMHHQLAALLYGLNAHMISELYSLYRFGLSVYENV